MTRLLCCAFLLAYCLWNVFGDDVVVAVSGFSEVTATGVPNLVHTDLSIASDNASKVQNPSLIIRQTESDETVDSDYCVFDHVLVEIGSNIGKHVRQRIVRHLQSVKSIKSVDRLFSIAEESTLAKLSAMNVSGRTLLLGIGNTSLSHRFVDQSLLHSLPDESFHISLHSTSHWLKFNSMVLVVDGLPLSDHVHKNISFDRNAVHYGAIAGGYAALELLGFAFLHPLEPYVPPVLRLSRQELEMKSALANGGNVRATAIPPCTGASENDDGLLFSMTESPRWHERAFHLHTQHPLELTEVLQGHDVPRTGPLSPHCKHFAKRSYRQHHQYHSSEPAQNVTTAAEYCERWEDMIVDVDYLFEWCVANRVNQVEWLLLHSKSWGTSEWDTRQIRLRRLTHLGHQYSLLIGADLPVGNKQQRGWYMVNVRLPIGQQKQQIRDRVDWIFSANFDLISTESGLSEFTHPECDLMLDLLNEFASYANESWGRASGVKVHCSTGQHCSDFLDPRTGDPINFNFLPSFAHPSLAVFPHTVQMYAFDDPTAGTHGNNNFRYVEDYLVFEAKQNRRNVLFYGETAYWVNYDIDVPLFLPLYGQRRLKDLRKIALRESVEGFSMSGQLNFDSGWEWGYWLNDVITARAAWDPLIDSSSVSQFRTCLQERVDLVDIDDVDEFVFVKETEEDNGLWTSAEQEEVLIDSAIGTPGAGSESGSPLTNASKKPELLEKARPRAEECPPHSDEWQVFAQSMHVFTRLFGTAHQSSRTLSDSPSFGDRLSKLIVTLTQQQSELLLLGRVHGRESVNLKKLSGIAYLCGTDTWVDLPRLFGLAFTQPDKVHLNENEDELWPYALELLSEMDRVFAQLRIDFEVLLHDVSQSVYQCSSTDAVMDTSRCRFQINPQAILFLQEIVHGVQMLSLRAHQVKLLYESRDAQVVADRSSLQTHLQAKARDAIAEATAIVRQREEKYRVDWRRIAAWRENPTVYRYGYLWSVHSLYNWWRDQGIAERVSYRAEFSPCYLNRMDSTEVAVGWGKRTLAYLRHFVVNYTPFSSWFPLEIVNCLTPSTHREYEFPRDL